MLRIAVIDDHTLFRDGLRHILGSLAAGLEFTEAGGLDAFPPAASPGEVALVLLDYHLPGVSGLEGLIRAREIFPAAAIVVISGEEEPATIRRVIEHGAAGFIPKSSSTDILIAALKLVIAGGIYLPPEILSAACEKGEGQSAEERGEPVAALTQRQREVLKRAIQGKANKVIARELNISDHTVKAHLSLALRALGVKNRTEAVYAVAKLGVK